MVLGQTDIGTSMDAVQTLMECHEKAEGKARVSCTEDGGGAGCTVDGGGAGCCFVLMEY